MSRRGEIRLADKGHAPTRKRLGIYDAEPLRT
jgi:hypothetical protein